MPTLTDAQLQQLIQGITQGMNSVREEQYPYPEKYRGDRSHPEDLERFISQVKAYVVARGITDEKKKVLLAIGRLTETASAWAIPITDYMSKNASTLHGDYNTLEKFFTELRKAFGTEQIAEIAMINLQNLCHMGNPARNTRDVAQYIAEFQSYVSRGGIPEETKNFLFGQGLPNRYREAFAQSENYPTTFDTKLKRAQQLYSNIMQNKVAAQAAISPKATTTSSRAAPVAHVSRQAPTGRQDVPMDIDASKAATGNDPRKCYNCNQVGHIARNCPQPARPRHTQASTTQAPAATVAASSTTPSTSGSDPASMQAQLDRLERLCATLAKDNQDLMAKLKTYEEGSENF